MRFITDPFCACCGLPFDFSAGSEALCGDCLKERPPYGRARAAFRYDDASRALVTKLKYADQTQLAAIYGTWLARFGRELVEASDVIIPVPLHYWRFVSRRYNQSALLASALHKNTGLPVLQDGLMRTRSTAHQTGLSKQQRQDNVKGAFAINDRHASAMKGKSVLLIDDVMTTAATIDQCTHALIKGGAMQVNVLTLARAA